MENIKKYLSWLIIGLLSLTVVDVVIIIPRLFDDYSSTDFWVYIRFIISIFILISAVMIKKVSNDLTININKFRLYMILSILYGVMSTIFYTIWILFYNTSLINSSWNSIYKLINLLEIWITILTIPLAIWTGYIFAKI